MKHVRYFARVLPVFVRAAAWLVVAIALESKAPTLAYAADRRAAPHERRLEELTRLNLAELG